jgi:hypothetical protein
MDRCKIVHFLFHKMPLKLWQDFLIRAHIQRCENCLSRLASAEEVKTLLVQGSEVKEFRDLWPAVKAGIAKKEPLRFTQAGRRWRWGLAAAGLAAVVLIGILTFRVLGPGGSPENKGEGRFQINHIRVQDAPASPFLFQSKGSDMILIWAEKAL